MDDRRKRLTLRAWRRGFREMDLIMGSFADSHAQTLTESELLAFEALLQEEDQDVYDWILGRCAAPPPHETALLARVRAFAAAGVLPS